MTPSNANPGTQGKDEFWWIRYCERHDVPIEIVARVVDGMFFSPGQSFARSIEGFKPEFLRRVPSPDELERINEFVAKAEYAMRVSKEIVDNGFRILEPDADTAWQQAREAIDDALAALASLASPQAEGSKP